MDGVGAWSSGFRSFALAGSLSPTNYETGASSSAAASPALTFARPSADGQVLL